MVNLRNADGTREKITVEIDNGPKFLIKVSLLILSHYLTAFLTKFSDLKGH